MFNTNPLTRSRQLIAAGRGWPTAPIGSLLKANMHKLFQIIDRAVTDMPKTDKQLQIVAGDIRPTRTRTRERRSAAAVVQHARRLIDLFSYKDFVASTGGSMAN